MSEQIAEREPYVGPRPFKRDESEFFFGREAEVNDLISLITAYQVVLLYAQSGAGKTSLLRASLIPKLEEENFKVVEPARVRMQGDLTISIDDIKNIFIFNALSYWNTGRLPQSELANMCLKTFLEQYRKSLNEEEPSSLVIVFDQFEEIFTHHLDRWEDRRDFFAQISAALQEDTQLRIFFVMREDYIAELDPYADLLPGTLRTRFRMEQLRRPNALKAITGPLKAPSMKAEGFTFARGVAEALVDDLMEIRVQTPTGERHVAGQFVEPVQLQVVCQELWHVVKSTSNGGAGEDQKTITFDHLKASGDVNTALTKFYERTIKQAAEASGWSEGALRRWFDRNLITPDGNRSTVLRGKEKTAGLPNVAIDVFEGERLLRSEPRDGRLWYELGQDRLIKPIQNSYKEWLANQTGDEKVRVELENQAEQWVQSKRDNQFLLDAGQILVAKRLSETEATSGSFSDPLYALIQRSEAHLAKAERDKERKFAEERQKVEQLERARLEEQKQRAEERAAAHQREVEQAQALAKEQALVAEKEHQRAEEKTRSNRRLRLAFALVLLLLLATGGLALFARQQQDRAQANEAIAREQAQRASESAIEAERQRILAAASEKAAQEQKGLAEASEKEAIRLKEIATTKSREAVRDRARAEQLAADYKGAADLARQRELEALEQKGIAEAATARAIQAEKDAKAAADEEKKLRLKADEAQQISRSSELATNSVAQLDKDPELALLLAIKAAEIKGAPREARNALLEALDKSRIISTINNERGPTLAIAFDSTGKTVLTADSGNTVQSWKFDQRMPKGSAVTFKGPGTQAKGFSFAVGSQFATTIIDDHSAQVWRVTNPTAPFVLTEQTARIAKAVVNAEGTLALTTSDDELTRVWDVRKQRIIAYLVPETGSSPTTGVGKLGPVTNVRFSSDGKSAITVQGDNAYVWDLLDEWRTDDDSPERQTLPAFTIGSHLNRVNAADLSNDNQYVVTASEDGTARLWEKQGGKLKYQFLGHDGAVLDAAFSPDGQFVVTAGNDGTARVWNTSTGRQELVLRGHKGPVRSVAFNQDNRTIVSASDDGTTRVWQLMEQKMIAGGKHDSQISGIALSKGGDFYVTGSYDRTARVWDLSGRQRHELKGHADTINKVAISLDDKYIATASQDGTVRLWDARTGNSLAVLWGSSLAVVRGDGSGISDIAFSPDGGSIAMSGILGAVLISNVPFGTSTALIYPNDEIVTGVSFSPDGRLLLKVGNSVHLVDVATKNEKRLTFPDQDPEDRSQSMGASFNPKGDRLVVRSSAGFLYLLDVTNAPAKTTLVATVKTDGASPIGVIFSNDGKYIVAWGKDRIWTYDAATGAKLKTLTGHTADITSVVLSADGRLLVSASVDQTTRVWDVESGDSLVTLLGHSDQVSGAVITPDKSKIITTSYDKTALIFTCDVCDSTESIVKSLSAREFEDKTRKEVAKFLTPGSDSCRECSDLVQLVDRAKERITRQFTQGELINFGIPEKPKSPPQP